MSTKILRALMRKLTDQEVTTRASMLVKRHRSEWCRFVTEACIERSALELSKLLGRTAWWVKEHLQGSMVQEVTGDYCEAGALKRDDIREVVKQYSPKKPNEGYVKGYESDGHTPEVARVLATAYEAGEKAVDAGVLPSGKNGKKKVTHPPRTEWDMKLRQVCNQVRSSARALDNAKIADLKRARTRKLIASTHAQWMEQIERIQIVDHNVRGGGPQFVDRAGNHSISARVKLLDGRTGTQVSNWTCASRLLQWLCASWILDKQILLIPALRSQNTASQEAN